MSRRHLGWILLAVLTSASGVVRAQTAAALGSGQAAATAQTLADRQRVKVELERVNAEIDRLKRENRGLGDDYRLRARMADAEALARRLTDLEARLPASAQAPTTKGAPANLPVPEASPSDDRSVLEAKADVLADQARRLSGQADLLARRVGDLRERNELRRRAGQLERDPFSALEQAKRRLASGSSSTNLSAAGSASLPPPREADSKGADVVSGPPPQSGSASPTTTVSTGTTTTTSVAGPTSTATSGVKSQPTLVAPAQAADTSGSVAMQFRGILDASTLAEIRRLETNGAPGASLSAMEHALAALRARAAQLAAKAKALRASAQTAP